MWRYLGVGLVVMAVLAGCMSGPTRQSTVADVTRPDGQAGQTPDVVNCELKNGPTGCTTERAAAIDDYVAELESYPDSPPRNLAIMKALSEKMDVLTAAPTKPAGRASTAVAQTTAPAPDDLAAEGCVWKGRVYQPGDSIRAANDGEILSSDLMINGQSFGSLSGQNGPWQGCDCSSSSRHWGCV